MAHAAISSPEALLDKCKGQGLKPVSPSRAHIARCSFTLPQILTVGCAPMLYMREDWTNPVLTECSRPRVSGSPGQVPGSLPGPFPTKVLMLEHEMSDLHAAGTSSFCCPCTYWQHCGGLGPARTPPQPEYHPEVIPDALPEALLADVLLTEVCDGHILANEDLPTSHLNLEGT